MTTLTIEIPEKSKKKLTDLVTELGGKIVTVEAGKKQAASADKKQILADLEESIAFVKQHQDGKVKAKSIEQLLDEL